MEREGNFGDLWLYINLKLWSAKSHGALLLFLNACCGIDELTCAMIVHRLLAGRPLGKRLTKAIPQIARDLFAEPNFYFSQH
jgi:hypothetical protein